MMALESPKCLPLPIVALLLRPLYQQLWDDGGSNAWRQLYFRHVIANFNKKLQDRCKSMCSGLLQYLRDIIPEMTPLPRPSCDHVGLKQALFIVVINEIHKISCWGLSVYGSGVEIDVVRDSLGKLQEDVCERLIDARNHDGLLCYFQHALIFFGAVIDASPGSLANTEHKPLFSLGWLKEKDIILKFLNVRHGMWCVPEVIKFFTKVVKNGVMVEETSVLKSLNINTAVQRPPISPDTLDVCNASDLVFASMLLMQDFSTYSDNFVQSVLEWLEAREAGSVIAGSRIFNISRKLLKSDKSKRWKNRFDTLVRKWSSSASSKDLLECLSEVAGHYEYSRHVSVSLEDPCLQAEDGHAKLLKACSSADMKTTILVDLTTRATNQTTLHTRSVRTWKDKEIKLDMHLNSSHLTKALSTTFPYTRHETAKKCLDRLVLAKHLSADLNRNKSYTFASLIITTMSPELQTLEALKDESSLQCEVVQQIAKLREKNMQELHALKQGLYDILEKFAEACHKEEEDVVWKALQQKARVMATSKSARVYNHKETSSEDILRRLFLNARSACKQMEDKLPNVECVVCFSQFSLKRKRACLDPCGHANACVDCAVQQWKRTKSCSVCKTRILEPIPVPFKLFF